MSYALSGQLISKDYPVTSLISLAIGDKLSITKGSKRILTFVMCVNVISDKIACMNIHRCSCSH